MSQLRRAAFIAELEDGSRMLYEFRGPIHLETEFQYADPWDMCGRPLHISTEVTITGELAGGTIWRGDMPTAPTPELAEPRKEITP